MYYYNLSEKRLYSEYKAYYPIMQECYTDAGNKGIYTFTIFLADCLSYHGEYITLEKYLSEWLEDHYF